MTGFEEFKRRLNNTGNRVLIQTVIGRSGSLFLQSLFDGHPEVLMFPGVTNFFSEIMPQHKAHPENWETILPSVVNQWMEILEEYNIYKNVGENNDEVIDVNLDEIIKLMKVDCGLFGSPTFENLFLAFHYSCGVYFNLDMSEVKCIYVHEHTENFSTSSLEQVKQFFKNSKVICILRDPRGNHLSIVNWINKAFQNEGEIWQQAKFQQSYSDSSWVNYKNVLATIGENPESFNVIRLEDIHTYRDKFLEILCNTLSITFSETVLYSTFNGKKWGGDNFSPNINGFRAKNTFDKWRGSLSFYWQIFYEATLKHELKSLNYDFFYKNFFLSKAVVVLLFPFWYLNDLNKLFDKDFYKSISKQNVPGVVIREVVTFLKERKDLFFLLRKREKKSLERIFVVGIDKKLEL